MIIWYYMGSLFFTSSSAIQPPAIHTDIGQRASSGVYKRLHFDCNADCERCSIVVDGPTRWTEDIHGDQDHRILIIAEKGVVAIANRGAVP